MSTFTITFTRTHTAAYVSDHMRNVLRDVIRYVGLEPSNLLDDWEVIGQGVRTWLETGHLRRITLEVYPVGSTRPEARLDFPIHYDGSGVEDDMWVDGEHLQRTLNKLEKVPDDCVYRVVLETSAGRPDVPGFVSTELLSTGGLVSRGAGTLVATPDVVAGMTYWKKR